MSSPDDYGQFYWCVKVTPDVSEDGEIYANADYVTTFGDGSLALMNSREKRDGTAQPNLVIAPGKWLAVYAASCLDGSAVAVVHWAGEVQR